MSSDTSKETPGVSVSSVLNKSSTVPPGYELAFTPKGIPFLKKTEEDDEAANEYAKENLSIFISLEDIEKRFGVGTRLFFTFLIFVMIINLVLFFFAAIQWFTYLSKKTTSGLQSNDLFVSAYSTSEYKLWQTMNALSVIFWFVFGPCYYFWVKRKLVTAQLDDYDSPWAFSGFGLDDIKENLHYSSTERFLRRGFSYFLFIFFLAVSGGIIFVVQFEGGYSVNTFAPLNFVITGVVTITNLIFQNIAGKLTQFEKHSTWSSFRRHHVLKAFCFKIINICILYLAISLAIDKSQYTRQQESDICYMADAGAKFLTLIFTDFFVAAFSELIYPLALIWASRHIKFFDRKKGDDASKAEFDVSQEYLELFYRQFVVYLGLTVFPMITFIGLLSNMAAYPIIKYRMLHLSQRPKPIDLSMKTYLVIFLWVIAICALVTYPQGAIFILSATKSSDDNQFQCCHFLPGTFANSSVCIGEVF